MSGRTISISILKYKHSFSFDFWNNNDVETRALHDNKSCILLKWRVTDCRKWNSRSSFFVCVCVYVYDMLRYCRCKTLFYVCCVSSSLSISFHQCSFCVYAVLSLKIRIICYLHVLVRLSGGLKAIHIRDFIVCLLSQILTTDAVKSDVFI